MLPQKRGNAYSLLYGAAVCTTGKTTRKTTVYLSSREAGRLNVLFGQVAFPHDLSLRAFVPSFLCVTLLLLAASLSVRSTGIHYNCSTQLV